MNYCDDILIYETFDELDKTIKFPLPVSNEHKVHQAGSEKFLTICVQKQWLSYNFDNKIDMNNLLYLFMQGLIIM